MELLWFSEIVSWFLEWQTYILLLGGFIIGVFSVVIGGGFFFSVPLFQWLFPLFSYGQIIGNLKMGSFFRGIGSTWANRKEIDFLTNIIWAIPIIIGAVLGVMVIAKLDQRWILPAIVVAIILAEYAPVIFEKVSRRYFYLAAVLTGVYASFLGAGIGIILVALFRIRYPEDEKIAYVKMQARFVEWLVGISAIIVHFLYGHLILALWLTWSLGSFIGGVVGGKLLIVLGNMSGGTQKIILRISYVFALVISAMVFLQ